MAKLCTIIGGGITGMTAALILAKKGFEVNLVEKAPVLGSTLRGFTRQNIYFDTGLHITGGMSKNGLLKAFLEYLSISGLSLHQYDSSAYLNILCLETQKQIPLPSDIGILEESLLQSFPNEVNAIKTFINDMLLVCNSSVFLNFRNVLSQDSNITRFFSLSLADYLKNLTQDKTLIAVLSAHCLLHGVSPLDVSFSHHAYIMGSYLDGAYNFIGGGKSFVKAFEKELVNSGVKIICNDGASSVLLDKNSKLKAVVLESGREIITDSLLFTAHPSLLPTLFPSGTFKQSFVSRMENLEDTLSAHILFGVVKAQGDENIGLLSKSSTIVLPENAVENFFIDATRQTKLPLYIARSQAHENNVDGISIITSGAISQYSSWKNSLLRKRQADYYIAKQKMLENIRTQAIEACPFLSGLEIIDGATPLTLRDYMHTPNGSLYGVAHSLRQFSPAPVTRLPGVWIAGQSVVAPGVLGAMISAFLVCGYMMKTDNLLQEVTTCV
ncbi:phytoene desaturase family protein [Desulfovibrio litoralis]|uniref:All-trans-retinol 13,14-reductase n=1 Tax=Desulfovibrio litoralis DSM 11393 TaxID=1121455 RepID=A0A1M7ST95_9BACT|nr:NAD(P)-binding protein [Desulfovibrio litoralis]SHN61793.1 all-trans-retinol 13,14-reductase [Desulfovibrio litoralis DSM 11393]